MSLSRGQLLNLWTAVMLVIAVGVSIYFTAYVWRRVSRPQNRADGSHVSNSTEDWAYYYAAAEAMREGKDIYTVEAPERGRAGYIYPPMLAFLYQPLAKLGFLPGARLSVLIDILALAGALGFAARALLERMGSQKQWQVVLTAAVWGALLSTDKMKGEFQMLQCNGLVALGMAMGLWLLDRKPFWAGIALGFAINIKYQAIGLILYLIFRKRWKGLGSTLLGTLFWAFLPALSTGLSLDVRYLMRGFSGVLRLVGFDTDQGVANIEPLSVTYSTSITSAAARFVEQFGLPISPFVIAGGVALAWLLGLGLIYGRRGIPSWRWPQASGQIAQPWAAVVGIEWMAVIGSVLAFSPQTNSRHLVLTALLNVLGIVLVMEGRGRVRWVALAGVIVMWMGLNLPPGRNSNASATSAVDVWHGIGGPTWGVLAALGLLTWAGLTLARKKQAAIAAAPPLRDNMAVV